MRFTLASMAAPGTDIVLTEERILSYRAFANKIWNAARFVFLNLDKYEAAGGETLEDLASPEVRAAAPFAANGQSCAGGPLDFLAPGPRDGPGERRARTFPVP